MLAVRTDTAHRITWAHRLPGSVMTPEQPQSLPAKNMQVSVEHRPSSIFTGVEHQPIPTLRDPGITRNRSTSNNHLSQQGRSRGSQRKRVLMMLNRHHQHMNPSLRIDVQHSQGRRRAMHHGSRHIPRNDLAKQTVSHNTHTQDPSVARGDGLPGQANFESRPLYAELKVHHPAHSYRNGLCCKPLRYRKETCQSPPKHTTLLRKRMHQHTEPRRTKGDHRMGGPGGEAPPAGGLGARPPISTGAATYGLRSPQASQARGGCVAVKSGGYFTATQRAPDRGGRCPAGQHRCRITIRSSRGSSTALDACCGKRLAVNGGVRYWLARHCSA